MRFKREFMGEFLGTFLLVLFGCGSVAVSVLFNAYNGTNNLGESRDAWFNRWMAVYFGIDSIESRE